MNDCVHSTAPAPVLYSVVVPVYNSASALPQLYGRLTAVMETLGSCFELIFVDDHSTDGSWLVLADIARPDHRVIAFQLSRNVGQAHATLVGLRRAAGEIILTLDDDLQHPPEEIPKLLARLDGPGNCDVVFGVSALRRHAVWRRLASWTLNLAFSPLLRKPMALRFTGFRAIRRPVAQRLGALQRSDPFLSALLFQITRQIDMVAVDHAASKLTASRYSLGKLAQASLGLFGGLTDRGRRLSAVVGLGTGVMLLTFTGLASQSRPIGIAALPWLVAATAIGILSAAFGIAAAVAERRLVDCRSRAPTADPIRRMIGGGRERDFDCVV